MKLYTLFGLLFLSFFTRYACGTVELGSFEEEAKNHKWAVKAEDNLPNVLILGG